MRIKRLKYKRHEENYEAVQRIFRANDFHPYRGVEVGVRHGDFAEYILLNNPLLSLTLVDPYLPYNDLGYEFTKEEQNKIAALAFARLEYTSSKFIFSPSVEAAASYSSPEFDFAFIDAEHTYKACLSDLTAWAPLIIPGGILMGHDYSMYDVKKAVKEWTEKNGYKEEELLHTGVKSDVWAIKLR